LTRGPIHEAFAEPLVYAPQPTPVLTKRPPDPIEELPPDQKPEGENVEWIPGYWAWDESLNDYLWISGVWRAIPPGRQWVPGYWNEVEGGFQWVTGAWMSAEQEQVEYLPQPPETLEAGPNVESPGADYTWAPGCWYWREERYVWRPGYWVAVQPDWVWIPAHYVWTPGGCLFVEGYWDLAIDRRGVLFAPVAIQPVILAQPQFVYTPSYAISTTVVVQHLFVQPRFHQYCFGDYYSDWGGNRGGIVPWFSFSISRGGGYDPLYAPSPPTQPRRDPGWSADFRQAYVLRRDHQEFRPPHTVVQQSTLVQNRCGPTG